MRILFIASFLCALSVACSSQTAKPSSKAALEAADGSADSTCSGTGSVREAPPTGQCDEGSECEFSNPQRTCEPGVQYIGKPNSYRCTCSSGSWSCAIIAGGYGLITCPGHNDAGDEAGDASDGG